MEADSGVLGDGTTETAKNERRRRTDDGYFSMPKHGKEKEEKGENRISMCVSPN
jgi:hypothetical protein